MDTFNQVINLSHKDLNEGWMVTVVATILNLIILALSLDSLLYPESHLA